VNYSTLSHESETCSRSPAISSTAFDTRPPDLPPASLMDTDFVVSCQLVRRRRPQIRFLSISPYLCSTLPSDPASRRRPCASLPFTSIRLGRDFHPSAVEHARRTTKEGSLAAPLFVPYCVVSEARKKHVCFASDAHRKSGVISFGAALSPVESCSLRSSLSSRLACTPPVRRMQAKRG